jgi:hypothetical protein
LDATHPTPFNERPVSVRRQLLKGNKDKGQLCLPANYEDTKGEFSDCSLTSVIAWDHVFLALK